MVDCPPTSSPCISCDTAGAVCTPHDDYNGSYNNYPRGLFWAPRGKHLVSYFADNTCRIFDVDQGLSQPIRTAQASGTITAVEMCPLGAEPADFHYAVSVRDRPIHLVNLLTGEVAASYQGYSLTDEVRAASCLAFSQDGSRLLGGVAGQPQVWLWDLTRPGKSAYHRVLSTRKGKTGQRGIVSAAAWVDDKCYALGTYSRSIGIYDERQGSKRNAKCVKMLSAPDGGGITSLKYDTLTGDLLGKCCVASSGAPCIAAQIEPVSLSRLAVGTGQRVWPTYVSMGDDDNTELLQPKTDNRVAVVNFSAPEGLLSTTLPAAVPTPIEAPFQHDQPIVGSDSEEAAAQVSELAEPQPVIIPEAFKGLPPPPGVIAPPCSAQMPCNENHEDPADSSPLEGQAEAGPTTAIGDIDMADATEP
ncbi:hypothetical protein Pmar_PMAR026207 [Perkinsus marinus ATCC 50983]|uniref:Telomerase Cajal body protein 1 n=1 Tax=Perkinsus marinus (strain ATCC 50983 / TXsc) TaxID=423536 RepID=C5L9S3_PERM5|nr:hypothetical protein Pmar_PMAR026207 [Perkinsus marinus ATCC 50983]EER06520.1 hypothetical protein Pmar_PMAR026207 [Perkinsus marinus ATCC 50983]|eukprot:XP_002774704.1 hypothetical protein Pmar_PMAR026207 [Perkinsus marinus ATCC 50983]